MDAEGRRGRVETALWKEFAERPDIGPAERAALRAQAHAVDLAEHAADYMGVTAANRVYLELRQAAGLCAGTAPVADSFTQLMAELGMPDPGVRHPAQ
jgi:hypothetical protein